MKNPTAQINGTLTAIWVVPNERDYHIELLGKGYLTNFVFCVVGAVTVLWIWKKLFD